MPKKNIFSIIVILFICFCASVSSVFASEASILIDADTGEILYEKSASEKKYPASLTKLMTLYLVFDALSKNVISEDEYLTVSKNAALKPATKLGLKPGEKITYKDAILGLVIKSANDAATVIAENLSESEEKFADVMTKAAKEIGMKDTVFKDASGLNDYDQITTAKDMALLSLALYKHFPKYYTYFSARSFEYNGKTYTTHNNILDMYDGADGFKTGYTRASGYNLSASAVRTNDKGEKKRLIGVILAANGSYERDREMIELLDFGFTKLSFDAVNDYEHRIKSASKKQKNKYYAKNMPQSFYNVNDYDYKGPWGIQVGAFKSKFTAEKMLHMSQAKLSNKYGVFEPVITTTKRNGIKLYRARLSGMDRGHANRTCDYLRRSGSDCFVVSPNMLAMN